MPRRRPTTCPLRSRERLIHHPRALRHISQSRPRADPQADSTQASSLIHTHTHTRTAVLRVQKYMCHNTLVSFAFIFKVMDVEERRPLWDAPRCPPPACRSVPPASCESAPSRESDGAVTRRKYEEKDAIGGKEYIVTMFGRSLAAAGRPSPTKFRPLARPSAGRARGRRFKTRDEDMMKMRQSRLPYMGGALRPLLTLLCRTAPECQISLPFT